MTDTITMDRAEYDETMAQLRSQAAEIRRLREALKRWEEDFKTGRNEPLVIASESTRALLAEIEGDDK
ncbi:MAG: hypothetical protein ACPGVG_16395 [Mycobacterium sp.]